MKKLEKSKEGAGCCAAEDESLSAVLGVPKLKKKPEFPSDGADGGGRAGGVRSSEGLLVLVLVVLEGEEIDVIVEERENGCGGGECVGGDILGTASAVFSFSWF